MSPGLYRLTRPLMALIPEGERLAAHRIPVGELIEIESNPAQDRGLVEVKWGDASVMVFHVDVTMRTKLTESRGLIPGVVTPSSWRLDSA